MSAANGMEFLTGTLNALIAISLFALIGRFLIDRFSTDLPTRFGAYCLAIGFAIGRYAEDIRAQTEARTLGDVIGAAIALSLFWWLWFGRDNRRRN